MSPEQDPPAAGGVPDKTDALLPEAESLPLVEFAELSQGSKKVLIRLDGVIYTLTRTSKNRLILHK